MMPTLLHTRLISLRLSSAEENILLAEGRLVDVRKRGIVPLAGAIQGPGIIHDMSVRVWLGIDDLRIRRIEPVMSAYPFSPSPQTRGESCPDRLADVQQVLDLPLLEGYGDALMERIGGPRGCFHVLTLLRVLGPSIVWATRGEGGHRSSALAGRTAGAPIFARSIVVDGLRHDRMEIDLQGGLCDIHYSPAVSDSPAREELHSGFEAMITLRVELPSMAAHAATGRARRCGPGVENVGSWQPIDALGGLHGLVLRKGFSAQVQELFADAHGIQPVTHLVFMSAPVVMQCIPSLLDELEVRRPRTEGPHAATDSCHMWRAGGPLHET